MGETAGTFATLAPLISGASGVATGVMQASALRAQGSYEKSAAEVNATWQELQAKDAAKRAAEEVSARGARTARLIGAQRAAAAANGVNPDAGSALELQQDAEYMGKLDALTIENNAFKEAIGYKAGAAATRSRGQFGQLAAKSAARQTLISSGLQFTGDVAQAGYNYDRYGKGKKDNA